MTDMEESHIYRVPLTERTVEWLAAEVMMLQCQLANAEQIERQHARADICMIQAVKALGAALIHHPRLTKSDVIKLGRTLQWGETTAVHSAAKAIATDSWHVP